MDGKRSSWDWGRNWPLHVMLLPGLILVLVFVFGPLPGIVMAFQDYQVGKGILGSDMVGLKHFERIWVFDKPKEVIVNSFQISLLKVAFNLAVPVAFALLLNEIRKRALQRTIQTLVYFPHFLSWVILGGIFVDLLSMGGLVNQTLNALFGIGPVFFLGEGAAFVAAIVTTDVWKEFGFATIVYMAAIAGVNPELYEAAVVDGASRFRQAVHVTLPAIVPIFIVVGTLALGNVLNAGFDQIFNMYSPLVYEQGDIIDTYVYREGLNGANFSFGTAMGLFKSVVGMIFILASYVLARKLADYKVF